MNPDARLDAIEDIRCDEMARDERREARDETHRAEDRRGREQTRPVSDGSPAQEKSSTGAAARGVTDPTNTAPALTEVPNLTGLWLGEYGANRVETIRIEQEGLNVVATKVTGDTNVPAGMPTFKATIAGRQSEGLGHVADAGYQNPRWVFGRLSIVGSDVIEFSFAGLGRPVRLLRVKQ